MKKTLKRLPFLLAFVVTLIVASCSDVDVTPRTDEDDDPPIVIKPTPVAPSNTSDSTAVAFGG